MVTNCPRCKSQLQPTLAHEEGSLSTCFSECPHCNTYVNQWYPQPQQYMFLQDPHRFKGNFGAYGSAKTSASIQAIIKHILITPNGTGLIGANILPQLEQTIKREFDQAIPRAFIESFSNQKQFYTFRNGYRLLWRPLDEAGKLRSLNLDLIVFVEGSEIDEAFWSVAKTRLRNMSATVIDTAKTAETISDFIKHKKRHPDPAERQALTHFLADWRSLWVESNPDSGWIKQEVFTPASTVYLAGDPLFKPTTQSELALKELDSATSVHIASTSANAYLPRDYIRNLIKNKPQWWINRYVLSSFEYSEGLIFPAALNNARTETSHILTAAPVPPASARFLLAHDYGLSDPAGIILCYIDPQTSKLIIYKEYKQHNNHITDLANQIKLIARFAPAGSWLRPFIIDPKSGPKRDYNKKSLIDLYAENGIHFQPASTPQVEPGIYKLNTYFEDDRILISPECPELIKELSQYSFKQSKDSSNTDKPEDKNSHLIDPLRWIVMELPSDPNNLLQAIYNAQGIRLPQTDDLAYAYGFNALDPLSSKEPDYIPHVSPSQYLNPPTLEDPYAPPTDIFGRPIIHTNPNAVNFMQEISRQSSNESVTISVNRWNPLEE